MGGGPSSQRAGSVKLDDILYCAKKLNIPYTYALNMVNDTPGDVADLINSIKQQISGPLYIEMGNELEVPGTSFRTGREYMKRVRELAAAVHKVDPTIKIGVCGGEPHYVPEKILSSPFSDQYKGGNPGVVKCMEWDQQLAETPKDFDAVIFHFYVYVSLNNFQQTAESMMAYGYASVACWEEAIHEKATKVFPGKEFWITEYNWLPLVTYSIEKPVQPYMDFLRKTPGEAIVNLEMLLRGINEGNITQMHLHTFEGGSGVIAGGKKASHYYVYKKIGQTLRDCSHYYPLESEDVAYRNHLLAWGNMSQGPERTIGRYAEIGAWGFGTDKQLKFAYFANRTPNKQTVTFSGKSLVKRWCYGGEKPFPDFMKLRGRDSGETILEPEEWTDSAVTSSVELKPYSMTVVEVL